MALTNFWRFTDIRGQLVGRTSVSGPSGAPESFHRAIFAKLKWLAELKVTAWTNFWMSPDIRGKIAGQTWVS